MIGGILQIKIISVGGAGARILRERGSTPFNVKYMAVDCASDDFEEGLIANEKLAIGERLNFGDVPKENANACVKAMEAREEVAAGFLKQTDLLFLVAGLGGSTGSGAAPVIIRLARQMGILTFAILVEPFSFEGPVRRSIAKSALGMARKYADATLLIRNDQLFRLFNIPCKLEDAFDTANGMIRKCIGNFFDLLTLPRTLTVDMKDVEFILKNAGDALFLYGEGNGYDRAKEAFYNALNFTINDQRLYGAKKALLNIYANESLELQEIDLIKELIRDAAGPMLEEIVNGVTEDKSVGDGIRIILIATYEKKEPGLSFFGKTQKSAKPADEGKIAEDRDNSGPGKPKGSGKIKIPDWIKG